MKSTIKLILFTSIIMSWLAGAQAAEVEGVDPETGFRMGQYRAPTPTTLEGGTIVNTAEMQQLIADKKPILIDVYGTGDIPFDPFTGEWPLVKDRETIEGAYWIPEIGRGYQDDDIRRYYEQYMQELTGGDKSRPIVFFCVADCWMGWNAAHRAITEGYTEIYWFPAGTDGWQEAGLPVVAIRPEPVPVD